MDMSRNDMLGELANDAALERTDFMVEATEQLAKFLDRHAERISKLGGLTLIDDDPDFLSIAPDLTFRVRSRYEDPDSGEWISETEIVETASELVELFNPLEIYGAFADAGRAATGAGAEPTATDELLGTAGISPEETFTTGDGAAYAGAADEWAAAQPRSLDADDEESAAGALYELALDFQDRSQQAEASLLEQFEESAARLTARIGDLIIVDDEDERLTLTATGRFKAEVLPEEDATQWRELSTVDDLVEFYDPTDVFGDLADTLAQAYPSIAPEEEDDEDEAEDGEEEAGDEDQPEAAEGSSPDESKP
jgi:hypothetical protein